MKSRLSVFLGLLVLLACGRKASSGDRAGVGTAAEVASLERHGVEVMTLSGVGHFLMMEDPRGFNRALREAVDGFVR